MTSAILARRRHELSLPLLPVANHDHFADHRRSALGSLHRVLAPGRKTLRRLVFKDLSLPAEVRPYQQEGISFLLRDDAALLADEMGLGKSVQTIVALR